MEDSLDYQKMVLIVESAGTESVPASETIDISEVLANKLEIKKLNYSEVSARIERTEEGKRPEAAPEVQPQPKPEQPVVPKRELVKEKEGAAEKLRSMVGGAGKEFGESTEKIEEKKEEAKKGEKKEKRAKAGGENLVMLQLSPQDQLADLEKIEEGIGEGIFNDEQLKIIKQEVKALSSRTSHQEIKGMSNEQREVLMLVNQRVKEIKAELNIK